MRSRLCILGCFLLLVASAQAGDLYHVVVRDYKDAASLRQLPLKPILAVSDGYLVLASLPVEEQLAGCGVTYRNLASGVVRSNLAVARGSEDAQLIDLPVLWDRDGIVVMRINGPDELAANREMLFPPATASLQITYNPPVKLKAGGSDFSFDLDSLVGMYSEDSLASYSETLESYHVRLVGSYWNHRSGDWIYDKLVSFGYDSVYYDPFHAYDWNYIEDGPLHGFNVVAVKPGTEFPHHHIVVGAHRDAVQNCPGADDNGSGTIAVMEMARVMRDVPTKCTWVFGLFDAEEQYMRGSWHYANAAAARGDIIPMMVNLDMIAHETNTNIALMCATHQAPFRDLWEVMGDSLDGMNMLLFPEEPRGSDEWPFRLHGAPFMRMEEKDFSTNYHLETDSSTYLNFNYAARLAATSMAVAYVVDQQLVPQPTLLFNWLEGPPELLPPGMTGTFPIQIEEYAGGVLVSGSAALEVIEPDQSTAEYPLIDLGGGLFETAFPVYPDFSSLKFRVKAEEATRGVLYADSGSAGLFYSAVVAWAKDTVHYEDFEFPESLELDWPVTRDATQGYWYHLLPPASYYSGFYGPPWCDVDGGGKCLITGNYYNDIDNGWVAVTSPMVDLTAPAAGISYHRWFSNDEGEAPSSDVFETYISSDSGATWVLADQAGPVTEASGGWIHDEVFINDFMTPTDEMMVRFVISDTGQDSEVQGGLDQVAFVTYHTDIAPPVIAEQTVPDWTGDLPMDYAIGFTGGAGALSWEDKYGDLGGSGLELNQDGHVVGVPVSPGLYTPTIVLTDQRGLISERQFSFTINPALALLSEECAPALLGQSYSYQIPTVGGTGTLQWTLTDDGLAGSDISLSAGGLLSGVPGLIGCLTFGVQVEDEVGAEISHTYDLWVSTGCGDVNSDMLGPNVADLTALVDFLFRGGQVVSPWASDVNGSATVNVSDLTYLVAYLFQDGPAPVCL